MSDDLGDKDIEALRQHHIELYLADAETAWNNARVTVAIVDAIEFCEICEIPPPQWAVRALREIIPASLDYARDMKHFRRYAAVVEAKLRGLTWDAAYEDASKKLRGTSSAGSKDYMRQEYQDVLAEMRKGNPYRYYRRIPSFD